jgi:hypothetical protein
MVMLPVKVCGPAGSARAAGGASVASEEEVCAKAGTAKALARARAIRDLFMVFLLL